MTAPARRILVVKLGALGDLVLAFGPMQAIRRHHAEARITLLTTPPFAALARACPWFDEVWDDGRPKGRDLAALWRLRRRLRQANFQRVYDLQTSDRSSLYFRLMGPGPRPEWSGIARFCSHPHANPERDSMHTAERQAEQLAMAGIASVPPPDLSWLDADVGGLAPPAPFALLVPGGSAHRPEKRWPAASFGALASSLAGRGIACAVLGTEAEAPLAAAVAASCPMVCDLTGRTGFAEIAALARRAALAVGNDTGPMHLIAAAGCPSLVLFSRASDPALCAPRGPRPGAVAVLRRPDLAALPPEEVQAALEGFDSGRSP